MSGDDDPDNSGGHGRTPEKSEDNDLEAKIVDILARIDALETQPTAVVTSAAPASDQLARIETEVHNIPARLLEEITERTEKLGKAWVVAPIAIGVAVLALGLGLLWSAISLPAHEVSRFTTFFWGGIVLISIGAFAATAVTFKSKGPSLPSSTKLDES